MRKLPANVKMIDVSPDDALKIQEIQGYMKSVVGERENVRSWLARYKDRID